jgi:hypothetical protein
MLTISPLSLPVKPLYLIRGRIQVVHEFGTFGAVNPAVVALQHPVVLLVGASGERCPMGRFEIGALAEISGRAGVRRLELRPMGIELATNMFGCGSQQRCGPGLPVPAQDQVIR